MVIDGKRFQETTPMLRMLAMRLGLYKGATPEGCHWNDAIMEDLNSTIGESPAYFFGKQEESVVDAWKPKLHVIFDKMEAKMTAEKWMCVGGNTPLPADFQALAMYTAYCVNDTKKPEFAYIYAMFEDLFKTHPMVKACCDMMLEKNDGLKKYMECRPKSPF